MRSRNCSRIVGALCACASLVFALIASAEISWSGVPVSVSAGAPYSFGVFWSGGGGSPPYISLYLNGSMVRPPTQGGLTFHGNAPASPQTLNFMAFADYSPPSSRSIAVVSANNAPLGFFDYLDTSVPPGSSVQLSGWSADIEEGAPVARVDVLLNGIDVGDAVLGAPRPDVSAAHGRADFLYSGWSWQLPTYGLNLGLHTVQVRFLDAAGASVIKPAKTFSIVESPPQTKLKVAVPYVALNSVANLHSLTVDQDSILSSHQIEYLSPGASVWTASLPNWASAGSSSWSGSPVDQHVLQVSKALSVSGIWQFRSRGRRTDGAYSAYDYGSVTVGTDSDGDGLPDWWEYQHGLNISANDANHDYDGDGRTNLQEYQSGTNPQAYDGLTWFKGQSGAAVPAAGTLVVRQPPYTSTINLSLPAYVRP